MADIKFKTKIFMKKLFLCLIFTLIFSAAVSAQLTLGNPSGAGTKDNNNFLVTHNTFTLSYNKERGAANWVMWHLSKSDFPGKDRSDSFAPDTLLPADWRIKPGDYLRSGYDRGHMCPSADRTDSDANNVETFLMSNIQPQTAKLNRQTWRFWKNIRVRRSKRSGSVYHRGLLRR